MQLVSFVKHCILVLGVPEASLSVHRRSTYFTIPLSIPVSGCIILIIFSTVRMSDVLFRLSERSILLKKLLLPMDQTVQEAIQDLIKA